MRKTLLLEHFEQYNARHSLFTHEDKILLTVSGGVDSMVMLALFVEAGYNIGVAHCNFSLRGEESDQDEATVEAVAKSYNIPFYNKRFDTQGEMERTGESMEMAARRLRYEWFDQLSAEHGYTAIAIAHHVDDSIETFFINLLRGTGLRGLTGITRQRGNIIRPLLFAERKEILEDLKEESRTIILYEAPHHLKATLAELMDALGDRKITLCRELTKKFETVMPTTLADAISFYEENEPKGEYVLVLEGKSLKLRKEEKQKEWQQLSIEEHMEFYEEQGIDHKEAMKKVAKDRGISKRDVYQYLLEK